MQIAAFTAAWWPAELGWRAIPQACATPVEPVSCGCEASGCSLPPEPFAGPILPFYRFLERENRIWRRTQAEADVARLYAREEGWVGRRVDVVG